MKTQFKEGLSYKAAINKLRQTGEISSINYKKALDSKIPATASTPKVSKPSTANRFNLLQLQEDSQSHTISGDIS